jgi:hypothetical protein
MYNNSPKTFTADSAVTGKTLVKLSSGKVAPNTATNSDEPIGVALYDADSGEEVAVDLLGHGKTMEMTAGGSISAGDKVYAAASGKIGTTSSNRRIGTALQAASGDGSIIEVLPYDFLDDSA